MATFSEPKFQPLEWRAELRPMRHQFLGMSDQLVWASVQLVAVTIWGQAARAQLVTAG